MRTISAKTAFEIVMSAAKPLSAELVPLSRTPGRVLAQNVFSDMDMPPFDKSAMDGYACRRADLPGDLDMLEVIPAGKVPLRRVGLGQCSSIMTGAPVPEGADCVVMVEKTELLPGRRVRITSPETPDNICRKAEDLRQGDLVMSKGELITPAGVAVLATVGCAAPLVARMPRVTVMATGSELVEPNCTPSGAAIRNSNSPQLIAQLAAMGINASYGGIAADTEDALRDTITAAMANSDTLILSGGVSMGEFDLVPAILREKGFEFLFESVAMQPGRPTVFAKAGDVYCFGLPGNPVSTFVIFESMVKPFLYKLMGHEFTPRVVQAALVCDVKRKSSGRQATLPVRFATPDTVELVEYHGSAHINAMTRAQGLLTLPVGQDSLPAGAIVNVRLL